LRIAPAASVLIQSSSIKKKYRRLSIVLTSIKSRCRVNRYLGVFPHVLRNL
jgi:hypothetical protein